MKREKKIRKDHVISTRISDDELLRLEMTSRRTNKSISDLMREALHAIAPHGSGYINS